MLICEQRDRLFYLAMNYYVRSFMFFIHDNSHLVLILISYNIFM